MLEVLSDMVQGKAMGRGEGGLLHNLALHVEACRATKPEPAMLHH